VADLIDTYQFFGDLTGIFLTCGLN